MVVHQKEDIIAVVVTKLCNWHMCQKGHIVLTLSTSTLVALWKVSKKSPAPKM